MSVVQGSLHGTRRTQRGYCPMNPLAALLSPQCIELKDRGRIIPKS